MQSDREVEQTLDRIHSNLQRQKGYESLQRADFVVWNYRDLVFLHAVGAIDWQLAGQLIFQRVIDEHGSQAEKERLAAMKVGYSLGDANELILSEFDEEFLRIVGIARS